MRNEQIVFNNPNRPAILFETVNTLGGWCDMHFHKELELLHIKKGQMSFTTENGTYYINEGEVAFFNCNIPHSTETTKPDTICQLIQFRNPTTIKSNFKYIGRFFERNCIPEYLFTRNDKDTAELISYMQAMIDENESNESAYDYYITANIYSITALLHRKKLLTDDDKIVNKELFGKIVPVIEYIDKNYSEPITLSDLSRILNLNEQYFCRLFKKATGNTATDYLNFVRICSAEKLLRSGENISDTSYKTGFSSLSYFNRTFKKYKQCSPSAYKKISTHTDALIN